MKESDGTKKEEKGRVDKVNVQNENKTEYFEYYKLPTIRFV